MSGPWYARALPTRPAAAWELYHENAKRSAGDPLPAPPSPAPLAAYRSLPEIVASDAPAGPARRTLAALSALLAAASVPDAPVLVFAHLAAGAGAPEALAVHDPSGPCFRRLPGDVSRAAVEAAVEDPAAIREVAAVLFVAADLGAATAAAGERGYRDALIAVGRRLAVLESAAGAAGLTLVGLHHRDRAADALFSLDGLDRSVVAVVAASAAS